jgi:hypothetical protein
MEVLRIICQLKTKEDYRNEELRNKDLQNFHSSPVITTIIKLWKKMKQTEHAVCLGVELTTHLHIVPRSRMVGLYLHSLICLIKHRDNFAVLCIHLRSADAIALRAPKSFCLIQRRFKFDSHRI